MIIFVSDSLIDKEQQLNSQYNEYRPSFFVIPLL